jgi:hypothetical protein
VNDDEARAFVEIWREELLREHPEVAREMRRMRRGMTSPSRIFMDDARPNEADGPDGRAG